MPRIGDRIFWCSLASPTIAGALVEMAQWLSRGYGIVSFFQLLGWGCGPLGPASVARQLPGARFETFIREQNMAAFAEVDIVDDFYAGVVTVSPNPMGVGGLKAQYGFDGMERHGWGRVRRPCGCWRR